MKLTFIALLLIAFNLKAESTVCAHKILEIESNLKLLDQKTNLRLSITSEYNNKRKPITGQMESPINHQEVISKELFEKYDTLVAFRKKILEGHYNSAATKVQNHNIETSLSEIKSCVESNSTSAEKCSKYTHEMQSSANEMLESDKLSDGEYINFIELDNQFHDIVKNSVEHNTPITNFSYTHYDYVLNSINKLFEQQRTKYLSSRSTFENTLYELVRCVVTNQ